MSAYMRFEELENAELLENDLRAQHKMKGAGATGLLTTRDAAEWSATNNRGAPPLSHQDDEATRADIQKETTRAKTQRYRKAFNQWTQCLTDVAAQKVKLAQSQTTAQLSIMGTVLDKWRQDTSERKEMRKWRKQQLVGEYAALDWE